MLEHVADRLGNTPAIARKAYVHPAMIAAAQERAEFSVTVGTLPRATRYLSRYDRGFLTYLEHAPAAAVLLHSALSDSRGPAVTFSLLSPPPPTPPQPTQQTHE